MTSQDTKDQASGSLKEITLNELSNKVTGDDVWLALDGFVYEVPTSWIERHPGGAQAIISCTGKDATSLIRAMHNTQTTALIKKMMKRVAVMKYDDKEMTPAQKRNLDIEEDFALLNERVIREGWYKKPLSAYSVDVVRVFSFLALGLWLLYRSQTRFEEIHSLQQKMTVVLGSVLLGAFLQNIAFFGHDAGHGSITADKTKDSRMGIMIGNGLSGVSMSWWKSTHNCHHIATNALRDDPDIQHAPLFCFDESMAEDWWSTYHKRMVALGTIGAIMVRYQHLYFYPVMAVARVNLYIQGYIHLWEMCPLKFGQAKGTSKAKKAVFGWKPEIPLFNWYLEILGICIFNSTFGALIYSLGIVDGPLCLLVSHVAAGILHVQILLSHIAMEFCMDSSLSTIENDKEEVVGFYEWQARSTMDISCPPWMDWFHGGLQFQLEHHLFPRVHKKNLPKLIPLVDEIFAKYNVPVVRLGFVEANMMLVKHLAKVGAAVSDKYFQLQAKKLSVQ